MLFCLLWIPIITILYIITKKDPKHIIVIKFAALTGSVITLFMSFLIFIVFDFSTNQFQFVQENLEITNYHFFLGVDGLSMYFILLTTIIGPVALLSNWTSISKDVKSYVLMILILETFLLTVFIVLDVLLFYVFFESILPPLFILIGMFGSDNRVKASFYLFLYTLFGSLFLLLSILGMYGAMNTTDFDSLFKSYFFYLTQLFLFYGIFIAFAVKTPTIFLNTWLLKAHVESPLSGSIILAAIVLKLSLYGILRLILPLLPKAYLEYTNIIFLIGVITIFYASLSTIRTIDVKELIAYSSVSHAAVYLLALFSNSIQGIEGGISLGIAHGFVSPGLFICAGGILYDRSHTRLISFYKGMAQIMPLFAVFFFILCLANCGAPLSLNFIGEFLSLYGVFERSFLFGLLASSSIIFSAGYTIYMYQKISFGGSYSRMFTVNLWDINYREFSLLLVLVVPTVVLGIYPAPLLDGMHYSVSTLLYYFDSNAVTCDALQPLENLIFITPESCMIELYYIITDMNPKDLIREFNDISILFVNNFTNKFNAVCSMNSLEKIGSIIYITVILSLSISMYCSNKEINIKNKKDYDIYKSKPVGVGVSEGDYTRGRDLIRLLDKEEEEERERQKQEREKREPCKHPIENRQQLMNRDFQSHSGVRCLFGQLVATAPNQQLGSRCLSCGKLMCADPRCACKVI